MKATGMKSQSSSRLRSPEDAVLMCREEHVAATGEEGGWFCSSQLCEVWTTPERKESVTKGP